MKSDVAGFLMKKYSGYEKSADEYFTAVKIAAASVLVNEVIHELMYYDV